MNRILIFHYHDTAGNVVRMLPAYYMNAEYDKVAVRINAEDAPLRDAKFNIYAGGVSIFSNRTNKVISRTTGMDITGTDAYEVILPKGQTSEEIAEDFNNNLIEEDVWVYCDLVDAGGGSNFTVQLELSPTSEGENSED